MEFWKWYGKMLFKILRLKWLKGEIITLFLISVSCTSILLLPILVLVKDKVSDVHAIIPINALWLILIEPALITLTVYFGWKMSSKE